MTNILKLAASVLQGLVPEMRAKADCDCSYPDCIAFDGCCGEIWGFCPNGGSCIDHCANFPQECLGGCGT